jgi:nucleoside-diphosphate-sugar epimerase
MNILLTGSNGFLGKILIFSIFSNNKIFTLNRSNSNYNIDLYKNIPNFTDSFDLVIHSAALAHYTSPKNLDSSLLYDINVLGTHNLIQGLENKNKPKQFVFISSVSVYGLNEGILIKEDSLLLAQDAYGKSKIESEEIIKGWCIKNNIVFTILRLPLIIGPNPPGNLGAMIKGIQKGYYFNINGGKAKKSMVLAKDVAKVILDVAKIGGIYNLTDGYHPTFAEISNTISNQLGKNKPMNIPNWFAVIVAKIGDLMGHKAPLNTNKLKKITSDLTFDDTKAREVFGWNPTPVLEGFRINK